MENGIAEVLFTEEEIKQMVKRIACEISCDYKDKNPLVVCVLKGAIVFTADLVRELDCLIELDSIEVSSYNDSTVSSGVLKFKKTLDADVSGRHIILVDDIIDSGYTMSELVKLLVSKNAASVKVVCLLTKSVRSKHNLTIDYFGADIPDKFVVGYGMDFAERYRNLKYIGVLYDKVWKDI